jgi:hypothetical protein
VQQGEDFVVVAPSSLGGQFEVKTPEPAAQVRPPAVEVLSGRDPEGRDRKGWLAFVDNQAVVYITPEFLSRIPSLRHRPLWIYYRSHLRDLISPLSSTSNQRKIGIEEKTPTKQRRYQTRAPPPSPTLPCNAPPPYMPGYPRAAASASPLLWPSALSRK